MTAIACASEPARTGAEAAARPEEAPIAAAAPQAPEEGAEDATTSGASSGIASANAPTTAPGPAPDEAPTSTPAAMEAAADPVVDATTATSLRVRVVRTLDRGNGVACGILHIVGSIEVEVLGAGEPPPRLVLLLSCPSRALQDGQLLDVELHARKQSWPTPPAARKSALPRRYVKRMTDAPEPADAP